MTPYKDTCCMYVVNSGTAAPLTLYMLEEMFISSPRTSCRHHAFNLILNLGVHAHLLEPMIDDSVSAIDEEYAPDIILNSDEQFTSQGIRKVDPHKRLDTPLAIHNFKSWILNILHEILLLPIQLCSQLFPYLHKFVNIANYFYAHFSSQCHWTYDSLKKVVFLDHTISGTLWLLMVWFGFCLSDLCLCSTCRVRFLLYGYAYSGSG